MAEIEKVKSFIVYTEQWPAIALLDDTQRSRLLQAMFALHGACPMPDLDVTTQAIFLLMRPRFEQNRDKYEERCEKNRENGKRGGRPRKTPEAGPSSESLSEAESLSEPPSSPLATPDGQPGSDAGAANGRAASEGHGDPQKANAFHAAKRTSEKSLSDPYTDPESDPVPDPIPDPESNSMPDPEPDPVPETGSYPEADPVPAGAGARRAESRDVGEGAFARFLSAYPEWRRDAEAARRAWAALVREGGLPPVSGLLSALAAWRESEQWRKDGGHYVPWASTFLLKRRWQNAPPPTVELSPEEASARARALFMFDV